MNVHKDLLMNDLAVETIFILIRANIISRIMSSEHHMYKYTLRWTNAHVGNLDLGCMSGLCGVELAEFVHEAGEILVSPQPFHLAVDPATTQHIHHTIQEGLIY